MVMRRLVICFGESKSSRMVKVDDRLERMEKRVALIICRKCEWFF